MTNTLKLIGLCLTFQLTIWTGISAQELKPELITQLGHSSPASAVAFSPDGKFLATASADKTVKIWSVESRQELRSFADLTANNIFNPSFIRFSPDGTLLAVKEAYNIKVLDVSSGRLLTIIDKVCSDFVFSSDGNSIIAVTDISYEKQVKKWSVADWRETNSVTLRLGISGNPVFSSDGKLVAAVEVEGQDPKRRKECIKIFDVATGNLTQALDTETPEDYYDDILFSPNGETLISNDGKFLNIWNTASGKRTQKILNSREHEKSSAPLAFSSDGRILAGESPCTDNSDNTGILHCNLRFWEVASGKEVATFKIPFGGIASGMFSPDNKQFVISRNDITLLDIASGKEIALLKNKQPAVSSAAFGKDYKTILVSGANGGETAKVWNLVADAEPQNSNGYVVGELQFSQDKRVLRNGLSLYDLSLGKLVRSYTLNLVHQATLSPDAKLLAAAYGSKVFIWDTSRGPDNSLIRSDASIRTLKLKDKAIVSALAFSLDAKLLFISCLTEKTIEVWDVAAGNKLRELSGEGFAPFVFNSKGTILASGAGLGKIKLWQMSTMTELKTLTGHEFKSVFSSNTVNALSFSADGKILASGSADKTIKLWDVETGAELKTLGGHTAGVSSLEFDESGNHLLSSGEDGTVRFWDVQRGDLLLTLFSTGKDWLVVTPDGLFDGTPAAWRQLIWRFDNNTFSYAPVEAFFKEFYYPGLLQEIMQGKTPRPPTQDLAQVDIRQPQVKITEIDNQPTTSPSVLSANKPTVKVKVEITDNANKPRKANFPPASGAQDLRLFRNGSLVKVWRGDVLNGNSSVMLEATVPIVAGENRLTAYAFNHANIKSADATLAVNGAESLKRNGTAYVLAVGVNQYAANPFFRNLKYAVADAEEFAAEVKRQQEQLARYERVEVIKLTDAAATKPNVLSALAELAKKAQPEDMLLVYFAGHGLAVGGRFYLIPHDIGAGAQQASGPPALDALLEARALSDTELEKTFEGVDAGQLTMIIDACNSGQALGGEREGRGPMNSKGLAQLAYDKGMYILTAAQSFQAAKEATQLGHGLLTYALVEEGLRRAQADREPKDGSVLLREWLDYATARVPEMQLDKMKAARELGLDLSFAEDERPLALVRRNGQRPRVFYRRELEAQPLIVAKPALAKSPAGK